MHNEIAQAARWNERYDDASYLFGTEPAAFLSRHASQLDPESQVLVVGDGEGRNSVYLAEQGHRVAAMDISDVAVRKAEALAATRKVAVDFTVADILTWPWEPDAVDAVVAVFIQFANPAQRSQIFEGLRTTIRPGGLLLLHGYRPEHLALEGRGGPGDPEFMYTEELLRDEFGDFEIIVLDSYEAEIVEGNGHEGHSGLIDLVARRRC